jgi:hypothetical protein
VGWYELQYEADPAADNVFGREALRPRCNPRLRAWLRGGGLVSDFILQPARPQKACIVPEQ